MSQLVMIMLTSFMCITLVEHRLNNQSYSPKVGLTVGGRMGWKRGIVIRKFLVILICHCQILCRPHEHKDIASQ